MTGQEAREQRWICKKGCIEPSGFCLAYHAPEGWEARDDEREALIREVTREIADRVGYQRLSVDLVRGIVREWDARKHPEPEITERVRAEQREIDAQIAEGQGIIGSDLDPYWEGRDDASKAIAAEIRKSRLSIDEVAARVPVGEGEQ